MDDTSDRLNTKTIRELLGMSFFVPYYQRGYRWTDSQILALLKDIASYSSKSSRDIKAGKFYCLQPIVVKPRNWTQGECNIDNGWEVIDGQQRLTTIYIILQLITEEHLKTDSLKADYGAPLYSIFYETRPNSTEFLKKIVDDSSNPDFHFISRANETIRSWFNNSNNLENRNARERFLNTILGGSNEERSVRFIWYQPTVKTDAKSNMNDSINLFNRLNIGKIPLTNSELIKALFLSESSFDSEPTEVAQGKKLEIALVWDTIEQSLCSDDFWAFITNEDSNLYPTKIELILDMIAGKEKNNQDNLYTFLFFLDKKQTSPLWELWCRIEQYYLTICEWNENKNFYHKIGYLVAVGERLRNLIATSCNMTKHEFEQELDRKIRSSLPESIENLSYDEPKDYNKIERILLLFNIESIRANPAISEYYPFRLHKCASWSLEHIHAQNSESLDQNKREQWISWLASHEEVISYFAASDPNDERRDKSTNLLDEIRSLDYAKLKWDTFVELSGRIIDFFSEKANSQGFGLHSIANLAILGGTENSSLNNSVFEVKRRAIIRMDREGNYIPLCTRRVFLKYYTNGNSASQVYFWGAADRRDYLHAIKESLSCYYNNEVEP